MPRTPPQGLREGTDKRNGQMSPEVRWIIAVVVGLTAMLGLMILVALVSFALEPPAWLQIVMGLVLVGVACLLTWLVASALGQRDRTRAADDEIEIRRQGSKTASREPSSG
jgi:membrane protein implicated in regulation of membrane protease activity